MLLKKSSSAQSSDQLFGAIDYYSISASARENSPAEAEHYLKPEP